MNLENIKCRLTRPTATATNDHGKVFAVLEARAEEPTKHTSIYCKQRQRMLQ